MKKSDNIEVLTDQHLLCRDKGHYWLHVTDKVLSTYKKQVRQISREWRCPRCATTCTEILHVPSFNIESRKYAYPDGYLVKRTGDRVHVSDIRREWAIRAGLFKR